MHVPTTQWRYARFGPFEVEVTSHELLRDGRKIKLQEMPYQILAILLDHPGQVVMREEFRRGLWPSDTFVDFEHSINTAVKKLREALEDDAAAPRYIETLPKVGYRFIASITERSTVAPGSELQKHKQDVLEREPTGRRGLARRYMFLVATAAPAGILLFALTVGGLGGNLWRRKSASGFPQRIQSLAVLPLQNLSQNSEQDYFADGLTDALITDLGKLAGLRVISHTSAMTYKKVGKPLPQIARELDVDAVVEGTVLRSGKKLRVTVQLVRASPEEHLWAERYERDEGDLIPMEKELALAIAHEVSGHLTTAEEAAVSVKRTTSPKALEAYLRGRYLWNDRTSAAASDAAAYFEAALREDPNFALAYSGLADHYTVGWGPWMDVQLGLRYARKAVELGPDLAETHASLGIALQYQCEFTGAGKELQRAVKLNPNYAMGHHWYAIHLFGMGRVEEALEENNRARRLDPFSLPINFYRSAILVNLQRYDQALEQADIVAALGPEVAAHRIRASVYWSQNRVPEAIAEEKAAAGFDAIPGRPFSYWNAVARAYEREGPQAAWRKSAFLEEQACSQRGGAHAAGNVSCDAGTIAGLYHAAGDKDKTLYWLKRGITDSRDSRTGQCWVANTLETAYGDMRSDPRFKELLHSLGLPE